jgi:hypothetical protein
MLSFSALKCPPGGKYKKKQTKKSTLYPRTRVRHLARLNKLQKTTVFILPVDGTY